MLCINHVRFQVCQAVGVAGKQRHGNPRSQNDVGFLRRCPYRPYARNQTDGFIIQVTSFRLRARK